MLPPTRGLWAELIRRTTTSQSATQLGRSQLTALPAAHQKTYYPDSSIPSCCSGIRDTRTHPRSRTAHVNKLSRTAQKWPAGNSRRRNPPRLLKNSRPIDQPRPSQIVSHSARCTGNNRSRIVWAHTRAADSQAHPVTFDILRLVAGYQWCLVSRWPGNATSTAAVSFAFVFNQHQPTVH